MLVYDKEFHHDNQRLLRQFLFEKRVIFLEGFMGDAYTTDPTMPMGWTCSPRGVIDQLLYLSSDRRKPITLIINSPGGYIDTALSLHDIMTTISSPIHTVGLGTVSSAAVLILAAGTAGKRFIMPHTKTMIHLPQGQFQGDTKDVAIAVKEFEKCKNIYIKLLAMHSNKQGNEIDPLIDRGDHWMNAEESKTFGLIDHIVTNLSEIIPEFG